MCAIGATMLHFVQIAVSLCESGVWKVESGVADAGGGSNVSKADYNSSVASYHTTEGRF